ncbi:MAG TPA: hypothetical protein VF452_00575, partial [Candidatus Binatia bacterium]
MQRKLLIGFAVAVSAGVFISACAKLATIGTEDTVQLRYTATLIDEVKSFGKSLGIEPTPALSRTTQDSQALSMLWLWMQRAGSLAVNQPIDIRLAIGFSAEKERLKIEQVYRVDGYSVYYRQGNEFSDSRSVATIGFAAQPLLRRVMVVLHEDLHGDANFALPWEIEESLVTPLGYLATVAFFQQRNDPSASSNAVAYLNEERQISRELNGLVAEAIPILKSLPIDAAKEKILQQISHYPNYQRQFERQIRGQHPPTVLEAKLSHDLAYYRYFDRIALLAEQAPDLKSL